MKSLRLRKKEEEKFSRMQIMLQNSIERRIASITTLFEIAKAFTYQKEHNKASEQLKKISIEIKNFDEITNQVIEENVRNFKKINFRQEINEILERWTNTKNEMQEKVRQLNQTIIEKLSESIREQIQSILIEKGRVTFTELYTQFGLNIAQVRNTVFDLVKRGIIEGYITNDDNELLTTKTFEDELIRNISELATIYTTVPMEEISKKIKIKEEVIEDKIIEFIVSGKLKGRIDRKEKELIPEEIPPIIEVKLNEIKCAFCGEILPKDVLDCPHCGTEIYQCGVCLLPIVYGEDFVKCPHCKTFSHRDHLLEWLKVKGNCPNCKEPLSEIDISA